MEKNKTRIIVRYLPQYHQIQENDNWWGEGFTEWTTVKQGQVLFKGHSQPKIPLNNNYYNLLNKTTMEWQTGLAKDYGIDGFDFYHYWFENGRQILEKPVENLLRWSDIDMPFCFTWANQTWARTWSNFTDVNAWVTKEDVEYNPHDDGVLLRQSYGQEEEWMAHIRYLIPFFKDSRYIRHDGKPLFIIYHPDNMYCWPDMRECWESELHKEGIAGLYVLGERQTENYIESRSYDARLWRFPDMALNRMAPDVKGDGVRTYGYDEYWQKVLNENWCFRDGEKGIYCLAANFDSTPRHGNRGLVLTGDTPNKFYEYFAECLHRAVARQDDFVFINAWNEWGEGAYLEPDEEHGYGYLEAIKKAKNTLYKDVVFNKDFGETLSTPKLPDSIMRRESNLHVFDIWMTLREQRKSIADWLLRNNIKYVAIYGLGYLGRHLLAELQNSSVEIAYIIDRKASSMVARYPLHILGDDLPHVEAIIVTPVGQYDTIRREIRCHVSYKTISLEHILYELL